MLRELLQIRCVLVFEGDPVNVWIREQGRSVWMELKLRSTCEFWERSRALCFFCVFRFVSLEAFFSCSWRLDRLGVFLLRC